MLKSNTTKGEDQMAKSVTIIKDILKREERVLVRLQEAVPHIAHKDTKAEVRGIIKNKRAEIRSYKAIIKASEKCPAVMKTAKKAAPKKAAAKKTAAAKTTAAKKTRKAAKK